jgi:ABC-type multidrug transport system permease subunit
MSDAFIREILSIYVFGGVATALILPRWVRWMARNEVSR